MNFKLMNQSNQHLTHCGSSDRFKASGRFGYCPIRVFALISFLACWPSAHAEFALATEDEPKTAKQEILCWIADLGSSDYSKRQLATLQLSLRKEEAIPFAILAVSEATGEEADRLLQFISSIASDPYSESGKLAFDSLHKLALSRSTSKSIRAEKILQVIGAEQRDLATKLLEERRAPLRDRRVQIMSGSADEKIPLVIDRKFTGNAEDLGCLKWLTDVQLARLEGPGISREILKQVLLLPHLKRLQLVETDLTIQDLAVLRDGPDLDLLELVYSPIGDESVELLSSLPVWGNIYLFGTKLTQNGQQMLKTKLDGQELFISRGGFLGVESQTNSTKINRLVPGGAAEKAGLREGDKMLSVNGVPLAVFEDLRKQLAKFADGEIVTLEYERTKFVPNEVPLGDFPLREFPQRGAFTRERAHVEITLGRRGEVQPR
jgi:hypothetical protein